MSGAVREFMEYFNFLCELFKRDLKKKYYKSVLGVLWTLLNPLLMMTVMTIVFSTLFRRSIDHYPAYYMCAYVVMVFNSVTTTQSLNCIVNNSGLVRKLRVPNYMFCLATVALNMLTMLLSLIPLLLVALATGVQLTPYVMLLPVPLVLTAGFTAGLSLTLSVVGVFFRDMAYLYSIVTTIWTYVTPMFYPISMIPVQYRFLWELNPMYHYVSLMRSLVLYGQMPSEKTLLIATAYAVLLLLTGVMVFRKNQDRLYLHL